MTTYISAQNVHKKYGDIVALNGIDLALYQGQTLALLGPNGAGKTTFIKILATLLTKDKGQVEILGHDLDTSANKIRHLFGYVGQDTDRSAYARLTVRENLHFFGALRGLSRDYIDQQIEKLVNYFNFQKNLKKQFMRLSGGQKQAVVIMRALLHDPPIVYLDEPTKGLDPVAAKRLRLFLRRYVNEQGKAILLTSHILSEVEELADEVALIHSGRIATSGSPDDLKAAIGTSEFVEIPRDTLPKTLQEEILQLAPVLFCYERDPQWVSFAVSDPLYGMEMILHTLRKGHIQTNFRQHTVSLEDAYLHHVGTLDGKFA